MDLDKPIIDLISKIPGLKLDNYLEYAVEGGHFLIHAFLTFLLLSLPISPWWGLASLGLGVFKELFMDGTQEKAKLRKDLIFRSSGALFPFITLLWK